MAQTIGSNKLESSTLPYQEPNTVQSSVVDTTNPVHASSYHAQLEKIAYRDDLTFNDFTNLQYLIDGGMSRVMIAELQNLEVVIKWVYPELVNFDGTDTDRKCKQALLTEKEHLRSIAHPNIIKLVGAGTHENLPFIVLEKLCATDVKNIIKIRNSEEEVRRIDGLPHLPLDNELLPATKLKLALEIAETMKYLHDEYLNGGDRALVHRDLKGDNVGLGRDGRLKLLDFGIATEHPCRRRRGPAQAEGEEGEEEGGGGGAPAYRMTPHMGTPTYAAPEVRLGQAYDEKVDVWSFGILLWELLSGKRALNTWGDSFARLLGRDAGRTPAVDDARWHPALRSILRSCWGRPASARASFIEVCRDLRCLLGLVEGGGRPATATGAPSLPQAAAEAAAAAMGAAPPASAALAVVEELAAAVVSEAAEEVAGSEDTILTKNEAVKVNEEESVIGHEEANNATTVADPKKRELLLFNGGWKDDPASEQPVCDGDNMEVRRRRSPESHHCCSQAPPPPPATAALFAFLSPPPLHHSQKNVLPPSCIATTAANNRRCALAETITTADDGIDGCRQKQHILSSKDKQQANCTENLQQHQEEDEEVAAVVGVCCRSDPKKSDITLTYQSRAVILTVEALKKCNPTLLPSNYS